MRHSNKKLQSFEDEVLNFPHFRELLDVFCMLFHVVTTLEYKNEMTKRPKTLKGPEHQCKITRFQVS